MLLFHYLVFLAHRTLESALAFVPLPICWILGDGMGRLAYVFLVGRRRAVLRNLYLAYGDELKRKECRRIARRYFAAQGRNVFCGVKLARMKPAAIEKRIRHENRQTALDLLEQGHGVIAAWTGMGPRELFYQAMLFGPGTENAVLQESCSNPFLERRLGRNCHRDGVTLFPLGRELSSAMQHLRDGGGLGVLTDWKLNERGVWCPLFRRLTSASSLPALLSIRTGAPIVPVGVYPERFSRWRISYGKPVHAPHLETGGGDCATATAELTKELEQLIRRAPEEWLWEKGHWKTPSAEFLLSGSGCPVEYPAGMEDAPLQPFRILVRSPNWLGDACMAVPAVRALKNGRPDAEIVVLCNGNLQELWEHVPHVDRVIAKPAKAWVFRVAARIAREGPWNAGVLFPNSPRSALEMKLAGVPLVTGYGGRGRSLLLDRRLSENKRPGPPEHHARRYIRIAEALGADGSDPALFAPREHQLPFAGKWNIGLCPGAAYGDAKRWPVERYARVVEQLHERLEGRVNWAIFGAPRELAIATELQNRCAVPVENLVGRTTLSELIERLQKTHTLITNDTGTMHLAALLGVRTVAIFGSTEPALTAPLGPGHEVLRVHVDCSPCFLRQCPRDFRCMTSIREEDVVEAAMRIVGSLSTTSSA